MIRRNTPPGTEIVCIDAGPGPYGNVRLRRGEIYTVLRVAPAINGGDVVLLDEVAPVETYAPPWGLVELGFELRRFRYLDIPDELTRLLEAAPEEIDC